MINEIYDYIKSLQIIDTHEHLPSLESYRGRHDVISEFLIHYFNVDLVSAGLSRKDYERLRSNGLDIMEKWDIVEKYWDAARHTGYGQSLEIVARDIYGVDHICRDTITTLNDAYLKGYEEEHYKKVLKDMCNIKISILDSGGDEPYDPKYFVVANNVGSLVNPRRGSDIIALEKQTGVSIGTFDDYLKACEVRIEKYNKVSPILKCALAYSRSLDYAKTTRHDAELGFNKLLESGYYIDRQEQAYSTIPQLSNYLFRYILGLAKEKGMIMQIHTGIQEGNGNILANSKPTHLNEIFLEYPDMRFDIFHIGYPYQMELGTLCKMFPNVHVDMCWAHIVSPVTSRKVLGEWLELFPYTKINGFGGDYCLVDGVYGHQYMARRNIAAALSEKVEEGLFDVEEACRIGKALLYDNPARIFGIA
jgi:predicted TIM-barrel fold metal-dependent hydrolase